MTPLSPREVEAIRHIANGLQSKEVAREMGIGIETVKDRLYCARIKLGARNAAHAVALAAKQGLL